MRPSLIAVCLLASLLGTTFCVSADGQTVAAELRRRAAVEAQNKAKREAAEAEAGRLMLERLNTRMHGVELIETPLVDALRWWSGQTEVNLVIDWDDAELYGADRNAPVTLNVDNLIAGQILILILDAGTAPNLADSKFIAEVNNRYVALLTKGEANTQAYSVVYDVAEEVLPTYDNFNSAPSFDLQSATQQRGGSSGGGQNIFGNANQDDNDEREEQRIESGEDLVNLIRTTIEPRLWEANGGNVARALYRRNRLIVRAPSYVHDQISLSPIHTGPRK